MENSQPAEDAHDASHSTQLQTRSTTSTQRTMLFIPHTEVSDTTRRSIRSAAAKASASARMATIARRHMERIEKLSGSRANSASSEETIDPESRSRAESRSRGRSRRRKPKKQETASAAASRSIVKSASPSLPVTQTPSKAGVMMWDATLGFRADSRELLTAICGNSALFQAFVLPIKTAWRYNPEQTPATVDNTTLVLLVKGAILGFVQVILQRDRSDAGPAAAAIALLAAWEMRYGSETESQVHVQAWRAVIGPSTPGRDVDNVRNHMLTLADHIVDSTQNHCRLVAMINTEPVFRARPRMRNARLNVFRPWDAGILGMLRVLEQLNTFDVAASDALQRLREINIEIFQTQIADEMSDTAMQSCLYQIRNAACGLCARLFGDQRICSQLEYSPSMEDVLNYHVKGVRALDLRDFETLIGTAYQEASFWALWTVSASLRAWNARTLYVLKLSLQALQLWSLSNVKATLKEYAYLEGQLGPSSEALFNDIWHS